jgi:hypothetical protein
MASKSTTAIGSKPVGTVASSEGREPYAVAASDRIDTGLAESVNALPDAPDAALRATRARRLIRASFGIEAPFVVPAGLNRGAEHTRTAAIQRGSAK